MNGFVHIEIPTTDFEKSKRFYAQAFGWKMKDWPEMEYVTFEAPDGIGGGFIGAPYIGSSTVIPYIQVASIEEALVKVRAAGGVEVTAKQELHGMGWSAIFRDPVGVKIGLWQPAKPPAAAKPARKPAAKKAAAKKRVAKKAVAKKKPAAKKTPVKKTAPKKKAAKKKATKKVAKKKPAAKAKKKKK